ncbi:hypothetical protein SY27_07445 [Flavobacterium sp. 316]|uniref:Outer membrane beta-barrel porin/alpha-amylase n=1 Tax=Flavobacterium sediminilitoris TaxID=2024526 RepID=A0ABY4HNN0_9FLAO|nr:MULTISPECIES: hypothetical protein [Flavobacterium]KIX21528.1 hypothetical protein SY27_07445 [Flavobacterium sp. 316]UOX34270.1 hypothetical protein LXD69_01845 [Flavobacterium sediminilitoris]
MKKVIVLFVVGLLGSQFSNAQSPWTREKGKAYVQLGLTSLSYDAIQFDGNKVENVGDYSDITIQAYAEYGITDKLEAQLVLPYKTASYENVGVSESISGMGNISLGLKYKLSDKNWKISSGIVYSANSIKKDKELVVSTTGFNASTILPYVSIGSSHNKWYYFGNIGYGYMDNDYSDFLKATIEVGYNIIPKGHLMLVLDTKNVVSKEDAYLEDNLQWASHLDRQTYNALGIKANYEFVEGKFGANFSTFGAFGIDNAPLAPTINLGVYTKF